MFKNKHENYCNCLLNKASMPSELSKDSFHEAIGPVIKVSQFFGMMSVDNVNTKNVSNLAFRWKSLKTIYCLIFLFCGTCECILCIRSVAIRGINLGYSSALAFFCFSMLGAICMLKFAIQWKDLMQVWYETEKVFLKAPYKINKWSLKKKVGLWAGIYGFLTLRKRNSSFVWLTFIKILFIQTVDHVLFLASSFYNNQQIIKWCNVNESEFFHSYLVANRYHLTVAIPYHIIEYPFYAWTYVLMTFSWNFMDLLVILLSIGLAFRFNQINFRLSDLHAISRSDGKFWMEIRIDYYKMIDLVDEVDNAISLLVLLSTGHNLFSLCVVIFEILTRWLWGVLK